MDCFHINFSNYFQSSKSEHKQKITHRAEEETKVQQQQINAKKKQNNNNKNDRRPLSYIHAYTHTHNNSILYFDNNISNFFLFSIYPQDSYMHSIYTRTQPYQFLLRAAFTHISNTIFTFENKKKKICITFLLLLMLMLKFFFFLSSYYFCLLYIRCWHKW